jgi:hypothetical protein
MFRSVAGLLRYGYSERWRKNSVNFVLSSRRRQ